MPYKDPAKHSEYHKRKSREHYIKHKDTKIRSYKWKRQGMKHPDGRLFTPDDFNNYFDEQKGMCAICGKHQSELDKALHVDHDHVTGFVRGLLCFMCNHRLSFIESDWKNKAESYLERSVN